MDKLRYPSTDTNKILLWGREVLDHNFRQEIIYKSYILQLAEYRVEVLKFLHVPYSSIIVIENLLCINIESVDF